MVRFIHTSDWQLGMTRHYLDADAQPRFTGDRIRTVRRIMDLAQDHECAFVLVAGDVFEHPNLGPQDIGRALQAMGSQPVPVYLLPGNHDPLGTGSLWSSPRVMDHMPSNVTVLDRVGPWPVAEGVELVAAPWTSKRPDSDPVAGCLTGLEHTDTLRIVVGHGMLEDLEPDATSPVVVRRGPLDAALSQGIIHYVALGDRHIRWPQEGGGAIHYSGTHETTSFRETGRGHVLMVDLTAGSGPTVTAREVGSWQHVVVDRQLENSADIDSLAQHLDSLEPKENTIVKTGFRGSLTVGEHAQLDHVLQQRAPLFASLQQWQRHTDLALVPDDDELSAAGWGGYVQEALDELMAKARLGPRPMDAGSREDEDALPATPAVPTESESAQDALRLLVRLAGGVRR